MLSSNFLRQKDMNNILVEYNIRLKTKLPYLNNRQHKVFRHFHSSFSYRYYKNSTTTKIVPADNAPIFNGIISQKGNFSFAKDFNYTRNTVTSSSNLPTATNVLTSNWILNGCYVSVGGKYYIVKQDGKAIYTTSQDEFLVYLYLDGTRHLYYNDKICDLELVPRELAKPKVMKIKKPTHTKVVITTANKDIKKNTNSPWRQFNPNYLNRDRAKWNKENLMSR